MILNSFITENGNLYCFATNGDTILLDNDVVNIDYFDAEWRYGSYIKQCN